MDDVKVLAMITLYQTSLGWRYRVGRRDDGYYSSSVDATWAANEWIVRNDKDNVRPAS